MAATKENNEDLDAIEAAPPEAPRPVPPPAASMPDMMGLSNAALPTLPNLGETFSSVTNVLHRAMHRSGLQEVASQASLAEDAALAEKSLLHIKLTEATAKLDGHVHNLVQDEVRDIEKRLRDMRVKQAESRLQDAVSSLQQANHFAAETLESLDDLTHLLSVTKFPRALS